MSRRKHKPPITMIDGNLVAASDLSDVWAVFRLPGHSYRAEPRTRQEQMLGALYKYACEIEANFQILVVSSRWSTEDYLEQMYSHMPASAHEEHYDNFLKEQTDLLENMQARSTRTFVCVRLSGSEADPATQASELLSRSREDWRKELGALRNRQRLHLTSQVGNTLRLPQHAERAKVALTRIRMCFPDAHPATPMELQWLIRRMFSRGVVEPVLAPIPRKYKSPYEAEQTVSAWLRDYIVVREHGYLRVQHPEGECFQAGIVAGTVDDAQEFSRESELMFSVLDQHDFPVDACLNVRWIPNDQARRKAQNLYKQIAHEFLDEHENPLGAMAPGQERTELAHDYHAELHRVGDPQLRATLSYFVAGETREQMNERVSAFRHLFPHACHRPLVDQLDVFRSHWPAQRAHVRDYERIYTPTQVAAMVPHASREAGSNKPWSFYYAKTLGGSQPVRHDLREASDSDEAPMTAIIGSLGSGKTMLGQTFFYHAFLRGAWVVDIDPKGDHKWYLLPEVAPYAHVIEIGPEEHYRGSLDPLRVALLGERQEAATTFLIEVIGTEDEMICAGINGAVGKVIDADRERACCAEVVRALKESDQPEFFRAGLELEQYMGTGIIRLGFARLDDPLVSSAASQVTVIKSRVLQNLGAGERATQAQRHSRAILRQVIYSGRKLLGEQRDTHKVMGFDETGEMSGDALGRQYINQCSVWSRSDLLTPILMTQDPGDVRGQRNRIGQWFVGKMRSREQIAELLIELELDTEGPLLKKIGSYHPGQFLYRDLWGRCEEIHTDPGPRLIEALRTRPPEERLASENGHRAGFAQQLAAAIR